MKKPAFSYGFIWIVLPIMLFLSCEKDAIPPNPCAETVFLRVILEDSIQNRYRFTSSATFLEGDSIPILKYTGLENPSAAVIITDKELKKLPEATNNLLLKVYKNDSLIVTQPYVIGKDSCHVVLLEGPQKLTIK
jgi:hypothetical protein